MPLPVSWEQKELSRGGWLMHGISPTGGSIQPSHSWACPEVLSTGTQRQEFS